MVLGDWSYKKYFGIGIPLWTLIGVAVIFVIAKKKKLLVKP